MNDKIFLTMNKDDQNKKTEDIVVETDPSADEAGDTLDDSVVGGR